MKNQDGTPAKSQVTVIDATKMYDEEVGIPHTYEMETSDEFPPPDKKPTHKLVIGSKTKLIMRLNLLNIISFECLKNGSNIFFRFDYKISSTLFLISLSFLILIMTAFPFEVSVVISLSN